MHEMALTQSVVDLVAERTAGRQVVRVQLRVGRLSGVVPDALRFCFDLATHGTPLEGAVLDIEEPRSRIVCHDCGAESEPEDWVRLCACGSADIQVVGGEELLVSSVEVAREGQDACA
jgi:hydrogenase nickel incorporation protein HypA/HybF